MSVHVKMGMFLAIGLLVVFAWHFGTVLGLFGTAPATQSAFFIRIGIMLVGFFVASVVTSILVAKRDESAPLPDEREERVELLAERNGSVAIYVAFLCLMWFVFTPLTPMQMANGILAVFCFTEVVKLLSALYYLRRGV